LYNEQQNDRSNMQQVKARYIYILWGNLVNTRKTKRIILTRILV